MIEIVLKPDELMLAAMAGVMRQVQNIKTGEGQNTHNYDEKHPYQTHIEGCCAEMAVSKAFNQYWKGKGKRGDADVTNNDVRSSANHNSRLILHEDDDPNRIFWHVTGMNGLYRIHGWIYAHEGQKQEYWIDPTNKNRHAFFVSNKIIRPPETHPNWKHNSHG